MCDVCKNPTKTKQRRDTLSSEEWVLSQIEKLQIVPGEEEAGAACDADVESGFGWGDDLAEDGDGDVKDVEDAEGEDVVDGPTVQFLVSYYAHARICKLTYPFMLLKPRGSSKPINMRPSIVSSSRPPSYASSSKALLPSDESIPIKHGLPPRVTSVGTSNALTGKRPNPPYPANDATLVKKPKPGYYGPSRRGLYIMESRCISLYSDKYFTPSNVISILQLFGIQQTVPSAIQDAIQGYHNV
jgi:hypothetical protein